jgi:hypothetical protein
VQALTNAIVSTLSWIHSHSPEEIMAKMPEETVGKNKELYLAALKNTIPMYSETGKMDPKGADAVLAVFSEGSPEVAKANIDVSKTFTNKFVDECEVASVKRYDAPAHSSRHDAGFAGAVVVMAVCRRAACRHRHALRRETAREAENLERPCADGA